MIMVGKNKLVAYLICVSLLLVTTVGLGIFFYIDNKPEDEDPGEIIQAGVKHSIIWRKFDGGKIGETLSPAGISLSKLAPANTDVPTDNNQYDYEYQGWATTANSSTGTKFTDDHKVTGPATYYVAYSRTVKNYNITFRIDLNDDGEFAGEGEVTIAESLPHGTVLSDKEGPGKNMPTIDAAALASAEKPIEFVKWDKPIVKVTDAAVYTAVMEPIHSFTLKYAAGNTGAEMTEYVFSEKIKATAKTYSVRYKEVVGGKTEERVREFTNSRYDALNFIKTKKEENLLDPAPYYTVEYFVPGDLDKKYPYPKNLGTPTKPGYSVTGTGVEMEYSLSNRPWISDFVNDSTELLRKPRFVDSVKLYTITYKDAGGKTFATKKVENRLSGEADLNDPKYTGKEFPAEYYVEAETKGCIYNRDWVITEGAGNIAANGGVIGNIVYTAQYTEVCWDVYDVYTKALKNHPGKRLAADIDDLLDEMYTLYEMTPEEIAGTTALSATKKSNVTVYFRDAIWEDAA